MSRIVGIDLGTTFSAVAHVNKYGRPEVIPNSQGEDITPSVVLFETPPIVGSMAKNSAVTRPLDTVQFVKRHMGDPTWRFRSERGDEYSPEDVSALILKRLKQDAEAYLGEEVTQAVVSVPAYFDDACRKATQDAGRIAGLEVLRIINEPTAAALAFGVDFEQAGTILVYDLGGGTFDVTIMQAAGDDLTVLATSGDRALGGFDWDNRLMEWLNQCFQEMGGADLSIEPSTEQDLRLKAELAKKSLSSRTSTKVHLSAAGVSRAIEVTREKFEELTLDLLTRTETILGIVLREANLSWSAVNRVLLVGGSTRIPAVQELVARVTGKRPSADVHPDKAVALGAAVQASLLGRNPSATPVRDGRGNLVSVRIQDITAHSLGVAAVMDPRRPDVLMNSIIVPKGEAVPCSKSEVYYTMEPYQDVWHAQVTEGEDMDLAYVKVVGEGMIAVPPYQESAPFEVTFQYDRDGIIHLFVRDLTSGQPIGELHIDRTANLTEGEVAAKAARMEMISPD